jgi:hypothetical protein
LVFGKSASETKSLIPLLALMKELAQWRDQDDVSYICIHLSLIDQQRHSALPQTNGHVLLPAQSTHLIMPAGHKPVVPGPRLGIYFQANQAEEVFSHASQLRPQAALRERS